MTVLDASVLIAVLDGSAAHHERARRLFVQWALESADLRASAITLAEVLVAPSRDDRVEQAEAALRAIGVGPVDVPADAAGRLAALRAETGLRLPDCCVLLAALTDGRLATFDERLAAVARAHGVEVLPAPDAPSA